MSGVARTLPALDEAPTPSPSGAEGAGVPLDSEVAVRLRVALGRISRRLHQRSSLGLSATELSVLITLTQRGPCRLGELAASESLAAPSMTRVAAGLLSRGLVVRRPDPDDGRSVRVEISEDGRRALEGERRERTGTLARQLAALNPEQVAAIVAALPGLELLAGEDE